MSRVYGELNSDMGQQRTKRGTKWISARIKTWNGSATMHLDEDSESVSIEIDNLGLRMGRLNYQQKDVVIREYLNSIDLLELGSLISKVLKNSKTKSKYPGLRLPKKEYEAFLKTLNQKLDIKYVANNI